MSIVIKGISMPDKCSKCPFCGLAGRYMDMLSCMFTGKSEVRELIDDRLPGCPVVALPEKHGRLIDADTLIDDVRKHSESYFADDFAHEWVDVQPTVVEAEGEE